MNFWNFAHKYKKAFIGGFLFIMIALSVAVLIGGGGVKDFEKAVGLRKRADELFSQGNYEEALAVYKQVLKMSPNDFVAANNIGQCYEKLGLEKKAAKFYKKAIQINPEYAVGYYNLGYYYLRHQKLDKAIEKLRKAISLKPDFAEAYYTLAIAFQAKGQFQDAVKFYNLALKFNPSDADAHYLLASLYDSLGEFSKALKHYRRFLDIVTPEYQEQYKAYINIAQKRIEELSKKH